MRKDYEICGDIFIAMAFVTFVLGVMFRLLGIHQIIWNITNESLLKTSFWCLMFSIALSLLDMAKKK